MTGPGEERAGRPTPAGDAAREDGPAAGGEARRVVLEPGGPVLVQGPVEVLMEDGRTVRSERFMVALCTCRRSRRHPWCDTSHRRRTRQTGAPGDGTSGTADDPPGGTVSDRPPAR